MAPLLFIQIYQNSIGHPRDWALGHAGGGGGVLLHIRNTKYEIFIASGTNIKYMETTCNKDMENDKQN